MSQLARVVAAHLFFDGGQRTTEEESRVLLERIVVLRQLEMTYHVLVAAGKADFLGVRPRFV